MAYRTLLSTSLSERYPESVGGVKPVMSHGLLARLLETELSPEAALFLAEPSIKDRDGRIDWLTPLEGDVADFAGLDGPAHDGAEDALCLRAGELAALGARLIGSESSELRLAGLLVSHLAVEAASAAAGLPGPRRVFLVGGVPVLAAWGLATVTTAYGAGPPEHYLTEKEWALVQGILTGRRPRDLLPPRPLAAPPVISPAPQAAPPIPPLVPMPAAAVPAAFWAPGWLRAILTALAVFLLTLLLFLLTAPDARRAAGEAASGGAPAVPDGGREAALRAELAGLRSRYAAALSGCGTADALEPPPPMPGGALELPPPPPDPAPAVPEKDSELRLPQGGGAADLGFLAGCWKSEGGIVTSIDQLPVIYQYCFTSGGSADVKVEVFNWDGTLNSTCSTTASASVEEGKLVIMDRGARCRGWIPGFVPTEIHCSQGEREAADCTGMSGDLEPFGTRFTYQGER